MTNNKLQTVSSVDVFVRSTRPNAIQMYLQYKRRRMKTWEVCLEGPWDRPPGVRALNRDGNFAAS